MMQRTILIVDDLGINRCMLGGMLSQEYHVLEAESGEAACEILRRESAGISAVLLDIVMPGMNGFDVLAWMRKEAELRQIPVIMITSSEEEDARARSLSLGANDFILKPYNADIIKHCLSNTIALREIASEVDALRRDRLTGLFNRETFFAKVEERVAAQAAGYYVMACFDIDNFKIINDQYGTDKGDEVLKYIAATFEGFEAHGGICCRVAADNFAVLYPLSFQGTAEIEAMRKKASNVDGLVAPISFSIGRYVINDLSLSPSAMYDRAVLASGTIKGRYDAQIVSYDESMRAHLIVEQEIVNDMVAALKGDQFEAWYQPQYNHATGALVGSEALARWRHPEKGLVSPGKFIPVFEQNGFVYELDKYIWEDVCRHLRKWIDEGRNPLPVSVNISRYDIFREDLVDFITGLITKYHLTVDLLRLEVTESAFSKSTSQIISVVKRLIDFGFTVEIDDFGSGYSSLNTLKDVPAQVLKLDMKFLESTENSQRGGNIVESIVRMAKWIGMAVIAEGVETVRQADFLKSIGCNYIQGYLYAKPMTAGDYEALCKGIGKEERLLALETVENLDNNTFWDPDSMDTLIFNSYVGGACILEYCKGNVELLRATDKYAQAVGSATVADALKVPWTAHLDETDHARLIANLTKAIDTKQEIADEYCFRDLPQGPHETYLRATLRMIATAGERFLSYCICENITAQREAEQREKELAEEMRLIMENVNGGIAANVYLDNGDVQLLFANEKFYAMYGYTRAQFEAELNSPLDAILPEDREKTMAVVGALVKSRGSATYEYRCKKRDGSIVHICCTNSVTAYGETDEPVLLAVTTDMTELVQARQKEWHTAQQLHAIMTHMNSGFAAIHLDETQHGHIVFANEKFYSLFGYTKGQADAEPDYLVTIIHPDDRAAAQGEILKLFEDRKPRAMEYRCVKRDGSIIYVRRNNSVIHLEGHQADVLISVVTDVSALVHAEQRAEESSERLQAIMDSVDQGITASIRRDGNIQFLFANNRYYTMLGYTKAQYQKEITDPLMTIAEEDRAAALAKIEIVNKTGIAEVFDYRVVCRDKTKRYFRLALSTGRFAGIEEPVQLAIIRDVTEIKEAEQRERMASERLNAIMSDINGGITAAMLTEDMKIKFLFSNDRYYEMLGYTRAQYETEVGDAFSLVHPDDRMLVHKVSMDVYLTGRAAQIEYRVRTRNGAERWLRVGISSTRFSGIEHNVNLCCITDITAEKHSEMELLDNLPCGAALYDYDGNRLSIVHINKRYWEWVNRNAIDHDDISFMDAVHPDDKQLVYDTLRDAIAHCTDLRCDVRILYGKDEYRLFHVTGNIISHADQKYSIYTTYTPTMPALK